jgi:hypothetical protein
MIVLLDVLTNKAGQETLPFKFPRMGGWLKRRQEHPQEFKEQAMLLIARGCGVRRL